MSGKHTPGPWEVHGCELVGWNTLLATLHWHSGREAENAADARLIAAAPDLKDAAADALAGWRYIRANYGDLYGVGWDRVEEALAAALAKARGEQ